jgi:hypothetical protein
VVALGQVRGGPCRLDIEPGRHPEIAVALVQVGPHRGVTR